MTEITSFVSSPSSDCLVRLEEMLFASIGPLSLQDKQKQLLHKAIAACNAVYSDDRRKWDFMLVEWKAQLAPTASHHLLVMYLYKKLSDFFALPLDRQLAYMHGIGLDPKYLWGEKGIADLILLLEHQWCIARFCIASDNDVPDSSALGRHKESPEKLFCSLLVLLFHDFIEDKKTIATYDYAAVKQSLSPFILFSETNSHNQQIPDFSFNQRLESSWDTNPLDAYVDSTLSLYNYLINDLGIRTYDAYEIVKDARLLSKIQLPWYDKKISNEVYFARLEQFPHLRLKKTCDHYCNSLNQEAIPLWVEKKYLWGKVMNTMYTATMHVFSSFLEDIQETNCIYIYPKYIKNVQLFVRDVLKYRKFDSNVFSRLLLKLLHAQES